MDNYIQCIRACDKMTIDNNLCPCFLRFKMLNEEKNSYETPKNEENKKKNKKD